MQYYQPRLCYNDTAMYNYSHIMYYLVVIPSISVLINNEIRNQADNITFLCQAVGEPVPDISWYFNGVMINVSDNSSKYMIISRLLSTTTTENTLTVYNVTSSDVGTYSCNATNIVGNDSSSGHLQVNGKFININDAFPYIVNS